MPGQPPDPTEPANAPPTEVSVRPPSASALPLPAARLVNRACDRFEADWRTAPERPRIEDALAGLDGPTRDALLVELIALDVELRCGAGEAPEPADYLARFPDDARAVAAAFAGLDTTPDAPGADPAATVVYRRVGTGRGEEHAVGLPPDFGDYELLGEIARGGMGVVYRARQRGLNRVVALKMILSGPYASAEETRRFRLEAELAANLDHPNVVPIHEVGEHEGRVYYTMKLVDGGSLACEVPRLLNDPRAAARMLATVARAVHYAHQRGFVHCDLKPANILLDAAGVPHVTDFGLARRVDGGSTLTASGALMGTPSYMAPEQASGARHALTPAADIYGLGAILYELLTGRPPFHAGTMMETVVQVLEREPPPPHRVRPGVPRALEAVCLKCLEKSPDDRFATAAEVAESLDQFLRGDAVDGTTLGQRLRRWTRREPELVAHVGGLALIAALTQYNYYQTPNPRFSVHYGVQAVLGLWAAASVSFQFLLRRGRWAESARLAWAATDVAALTCVLFMLDAFESDLVVGYPLLIAASGLWFRVRVIWFTTALAVLGYGVLYLHAYATKPDWGARQYPNIFMAALFVTGFALVRQVKRLWALSAYYENRPAA